MAHSKYEQPFTLKILDNDFNLVCLINYTSLQWDRKYNQVGQFVIEGVQGKYDRNTWKYVYTEKRKELGRISQVNLSKDGDRRIITLSGLFYENELNRMICYAKPTKFDDDTGTHNGTSILKAGSPQWVTAEGTADIVARAFFNGFKQISFKNYLIGDFGGNTLVTKTFELPVAMGTVAKGDYHYAIHNRNNEKLGDKLYNILKESKASYEIAFDYDNKSTKLNIIHGIDRTQEGHAYGVNPTIFSMTNGTIKSAKLVTSDTATADAVIQVSEDDTQTLVLANCTSESVGRFTAETIHSNQGDFATDKEYKLSVMADASTILQDKGDIINMEFDFVNSSYDYMIDYDLGDIVSINIPDIGINIDTQIVACHEVIKNGTWSMSIEVGDILRKRGS